jgi:hypothetical protein
MFDFAPSRRGRPSVSGSNILTRARSACHRWRTATVYAGIAIVSDAPGSLAPLPAAIAVIDRGVIAREERYLKQKFGTRYEDYKRRVRRWI